MNWGSAAIYLAFVAIAARGLAQYAQWGVLLPAGALLAAFLALLVALPRMSLILARHAWLLHGIFLASSALVMALALLPPAPDFVTALLVLLSFRAAHAFTGRSLLAWIALLSVLALAPVVYVRGLAAGLAMTLTTMAGCIVLPSYVITNRQIEAARAESQALLDELQRAHLRLQAHAEGAARLAAVREQQRLVRELHDSVSQTLFSITLTARAAALLLERDPARARPQLERLETTAQGALEEMRGLIAQLRPRPDEASQASPNPGPPML